MCGATALAPEGEGGGEESETITLADAPSDPWTLRASSAPLALAIGAERGRGGVVADPSLMLVEGLPGAGKSHEVAVLVASLGLVALVCDGEQTPGLTRQLYERTGNDLHRVRLTRPSGLDALVSRVRRARERVVVIDSAQGFGGRNVAALLTALKCPRSLVIVISQVNAEGGAAGGHSLEHDVDAVLRVEHSAIVLVKARYGARIYRAFRRPNRTAPRS